MKLNAVEKAAMNNPVRAAHQHRREAAWFRDLAGGPLTGQSVLEVGCGRGVGTEVLLDRLDAGRVTAFDLDPDMVVNRPRSGSGCETTGEWWSCQHRGSIRRSCVIGRSDWSERLRSRSRSCR